MDKKVILCILDGWGLAPADKYNAIDNARTPTMDRLMREFPWCKMLTDGPNVGLPKGQVGTSESNHLVIGSGTIPKQSLLKIDDAIENEQFYSNQTLIKMEEFLQQSKGALHLVGLLSDGGLHSHISHVFALLEFIKRAKLENKVYIHAFTDGRDTPPQSAATYLQQLEKKIDATGLRNQVALASLQGRVYLDRDGDFSKTQAAVDLLLHAKGMPIESWQLGIERSTKRMDEALRNDQYHQQMKLPAFRSIQEGDACLVFNFRTDRTAQLLSVLESQLPKQSFLTSMIKPSQDLLYEPLFVSDTVTLPLSKVLSDAGKTQSHISETEKHVHITYYFNGRTEHELPGEQWRIFDSNRFVKPYYNFDPAMQLEFITTQVIDNIKTNAFDFQVINVTNTDMVGHTGSYEAAVVAAEAVDNALGQICEVLEERLDEYTLLVTADHGNSDIMWDYQNSQPHTAHTHSPVPFIVVNTQKQPLLHSEALLCDIAPTILKLFDIPQPVEMTGDCLI